MVKASKKSYIFCAVAIVLILIGSILSKAIDTNLGTVKTERLYLTNDNGYTVSANSISLIQLKKRLRLPL